jgi:membrane-associated phospholipid phosphatase
MVSRYPDLRGSRLLRKRGGITMKKTEVDERTEGTPIPMPESKRIWIACVIIGAALWVIALIFWAQVGIDQTILFHYNPMRVSMAPIVVISKWFSSYGMAAITTLFVIYLIVSKKIKYLDAPLTVYLYTISSFALSGIAGDLLKEVLARPRPIATYGSEIIAISQAVTPAIPSGHATKSIALVLPFILLVSSSKAIHKGMKITLGLIALGVCFSRIVLGAHYLSDVLAGVGTALVGLPLSMIFANMILRRRKQEELARLSYVWGLILVFLTWVFMIL